MIAGRKGQIDDDGAKQLIKGWEKQVGGISLSEAKAIYYGLQKYDSNLDPAARARLNTFVEKTLKKLWSASPKTPAEAQDIAQQAKSLQYASDASRKDMQKFVDQKLPKLVQPEPTSVVDRSYKNDFATKAWAGPMGKAGANALVNTWGAKPVARIQAQQLAADVRRYESERLPEDKIKDLIQGVSPAAAKVLNDFVAKKLPGLVKDPDVNAQLGAMVAAGKGKIDDKGAKQLIKGWEKQAGSMRLVEANAIKENLKKYDTKLDAHARARLNKFVEKTLTSLVLKQDLTSPASVDLSWTPPVDSAIAGYKLLEGTVPGVVTAVESITDPSAVKFKVQNVGPGPNSFALKTVDTDGAESDDSNWVSKTIP